MGELKMKIKDIFAYTNPIIIPIAIGYSVGIWLYNISHNMRKFDKEIEEEIE